MMGTASGDPSRGAWPPGPRCSQVGGCRTTGFLSVRLPPKGRESQTKRQRRGGEPACVFVFKLFLSPRSPESHMLPPTSPESSHDPGPPSCDETNLPNFSPPPPPPRLTVFLKEPPFSPRALPPPPTHTLQISSGGGMHMESPESAGEAEILGIVSTRLPLPDTAPWSRASPI